MSPEEALTATLEHYKQPLEELFKNSALGTWDLEPPEPPQLTTDGATQKVDLFQNGVRQGVESLRALLFSG